MSFILTVKIQFLTKTEDTILPTVFLLPELFTHVNLYFIDHSQHHYA